MLDQPLDPTFQRRGLIVNTSSGAADRGRPMLPAYGASKAAMTHLMKCTAASYGERGICAVALYPSSIFEGMWKVIDPLWGELEGLPPGEMGRRRTSESILGRYETPEEVAAIAMRIATGTAWPTTARSSSPPRASATTEREVMRCWVLGCWRRRAPITQHPSPRTWSHVPIELGIATPAIPRDPRALDDRFGKWCRRPGHHRARHPPRPDARGRQAARRRGSRAPGRLGPAASSRRPVTTRSWSARTRLAAPTTWTA